MAYGITSAESGVSKKNRVHIEYVLVWFLCLTVVWRSHMCKYTNT